MGSVFKCRVPNGHEYLTLKYDMFKDGYLLSSLDVFASISAYFLSTPIFLKTTFLKIVSRYKQLINNIFVE
jgi:hypothetical protein